MTVSIATFPGAEITPAREVEQAFRAEIEHRSLHELGTVEVRLVGWRGLAGRDVVVEIRDRHGANLYELITPDMVPRIIASHMDDGRPLGQWLVGKDFQEFYESQKNHITELAGRIDPLSWEEYQDYDGYKGLRTFFSQGFDSFLQKVVAAGFCEFGRLAVRPLGPRWCELRVEKEHPILVVNAAPPLKEATPEMFLLEALPHQVLEGIFLASQTLKISETVVYLPETAELAAARLQGAWEAFRASRLWPAKEPLIRLSVVRGQGTFLMDDEELLLRSVSSSLPADFWERHPKPTFLSHSLMAVAALPFIAQQPVAWFRKLGFECAPGTMIFRLAGAVERQGFVEVPLTATLGQVVTEIGGGWRHARTPKGVLVGGPTGGLFPAALKNLTLHHETIREMGGSLALGLIEVLDEHDCVVDHVRRQLAFILEQPGAHCPGCAPLLQEIKGLLDRMVDGSATLDTIEELERRAQELKRKGSCQMGRQAANPILTALTYFRDEFQAHVENHYCDAHVCPKLLSAPCHLACPAGIDIPSFLALIAVGRHQEAWEVMRRDNPFPWVCGLICPHPCERACVRGSLDEPINIRYLKAFASEWVAARGVMQPPPAAPPTGHRVAVVGSGPAGLSCAYFLAIRGHQVTVFEGHDTPGGLLTEGIPDYRLPRHVVGKEIELVRALGVEIRTGVMVGQDITLEELRAQGYEAFFLGVGAHLGYRLKIEGETDFPEVYDAISFLRNIYLGKKEKPADKVVIIGGGNAAMDAARTCLRLGCSEVHVSYRRTRAEMPAHPEEVAQALEEGVQIHFLTVPIRIGGNGKVEYLECLQAELGRPDASGRRRPIPIPDSNFRLEVGAVITAIGQQPDLCPFPEPPVATTPWCTIVTEDRTLHTTVTDIFAGGDAVTGPATVVEAIAAGKQAAAEIHHFLSGAAGPPPRVRFQKRLKLPFQVTPAPEKIANHRVPVAMLPPSERRHTFEPIELPYTEDQARQEASRCLRCDVCIRCSVCEKTCRDRMKVAALKFSQISTTERVLTDYPRAEKRCIACGACALACPTNAIDYVEGPDFREVRLCGTVLNRLEVPRCKRCGEPFVPARYLEYVTHRADKAMAKQVLRNLCPQCARVQRAEKLALHFPYLET
jgi:NADH-quinone oxidoreductase subunit F